MVVERVDVNPQLITWARKRSGVAAAALRRRFPKLADWEQGERAPTRKQLDAYARATRTSVEWLLLDTPPAERLPIADHRTISGERTRRPTPDLLDTIRQCRQRQDWYRKFARANRETAADIVGALSITTGEVEAAATMRAELHYDVRERRSASANAPARLAEAAEDRGFLVMVNGVVGSNNRRKLDPGEFRGFALVDDVAPVVFVNGAALKEERLFTLAHELTHVWLGTTALCDAEPSLRPSDATERWCSAVAAEFLVPLGELHDALDPRRDPAGDVARLTRRFKVSALVLLRRLHDAGALGSGTFERAYEAELARLHVQRRERKGGGGNFYNTQPVRVSKRFARALLTSTLEGETGNPEAFEMLGFRKAATLRRLAEHLGVA